MKRWVKTSKELPPVGQVVKVRPKAKEMCFDGMYAIFKKSQNYGCLVQRADALLQWKIDGQPINFFFPVDAMSVWKKEIFIPITTRFEILDL
jgi:hypothetical protein